MGIAGMRSNEEISHRHVEENEEAENQVYSSPKVVVGYALTSKKKNSFLQPKFLNFARNKGIFFVAIDLNKPLLEQGPFDVVLHKLSGKEWREVIEVCDSKYLYPVSRCTSNLVLLWSLSIPICGIA
ncbi:hypothetical protein PIB30_009245 [Stylosanthes scabra]|uniref:Inositol-tetrakisphosphate 1-kinase N-terminal domain-containing protein n=1 Tax=Stylosanthes scabra TaxID=79078 RepID=A0ABU6R664_9FABA|nr:hypothetical protein [Stylosanthes scabra]